MVGYAPTEVGIDGVLHEYSTVDGVQEDVVDILLNLKGIVFKLHNRDVVNLKLVKEGEGAFVPAISSCRMTSKSSIRARHCPPVPGGKLAMEIKVEKGRGYVPGNVRNLGDAKTIGKLVLDASFSPIRRVAYAVESARVEQRTDLDKLMVDIETNGVVEPEEAIRYAARVLMEQLSVSPIWRGPLRWPRLPSRPG